MLTRLAPFKLVDDVLAATGRTRWRSTSRLVSRRACSAQW
nr:hypothetical protein [Micromonospora wenchangensis]